MRCLLTRRNPGTDYDFPCRFAVAVPDDYRYARQLDQLRDHFWTEHRLKLSVEDA
jgi:hypothetical protein